MQGLRSFADLKAEIPAQSMTAHPCQQPAAHGPPTDWSAPSGGDGVRSPIGTGQEVHV